MSVFGGDSWAREAQQRKRRVEDLMLDGGLPSSSYKKLSNGKYACLVCPNNPLLDTPLMLSMHNKGTRHIAAESMLKERDLSRQTEMNKRIALSGHSTAGTSMCTSTRHSEVHRKPLIAQTQKAILEAQCMLTSGTDGCYNVNPKKKSPVFNSNFTVASNQLMKPSQSLKYDVSNCYDKKGVCTTGASGKMPIDRYLELKKRQYKELKFTAAGWKRDCNGIWYKDENVEFDSDEDDPNVCLP